MHTPTVISSRADLVSGLAAACKAAKCISTPTILTYSWYCSALINVYIMHVTTQMLTNITKHWVKFNIFRREDLNEPKQSPLSVDVNPSLQIHLYEPRTLLHVPFLHILGSEHSSRSKKRNHWGLLHIFSSKLPRKKKWNKKNSLNKLALNYYQHMHLGW